MGIAIEIACFIDEMLIGGIYSFFALSQSPNSFSFSSRLSVSLCRFILFGSPHNISFREEIFTWIQAIKKPNLISYLMYQNCDERYEQERRERIWRKNKSCTNETNGVEVRDMSAQGQQRKCIRSIAAAALFLCFLFAVRESIFFLPLLLRRKQSYVVTNSISIAIIWRCCTSDIDKERKFQVDLISGYEFGSEFGWNHSIGNVYRNAHNSTNTNIFLLLLFLFA